MSGNKNSEKNLTLATKAKAKKAKDDTEKLIKKIEKEVEASLKNGTYGNMPTSFHGFATKYSIPQTVKKNKDKDAVYRNIYARIEVLVGKIENPPLAEKTEKAYKDDIRRLERTIKTLAGSNANLQETVVVLRTALEDERAINSIKARNAANKAVEEKNNNVVGINDGPE